MNHETRKHARLSGSKIERALLCPGSVQLEETVPRTTNEAAERGTTIHEIAEAVMRGQDLSVVHADKPQDWIDEAKGYAHTVYEYTKEWAKKRMVELNTSTGLQAIHESLGGTADYVAIGSGRLLVADLKTGRSIVNPDNNPQLLTYALGAALQLKAPKSIAITLGIYQSGQLKTWHCDYTALEQWREVLSELAEKVWARNPQRTPSNKACQWCNAKAICPELSNAAIELASQSAKSDFAIIHEKDDLLAPVPALPILDMRDALDAATLLEGWIDAVRAKAKEDLTSGQTIHGWKLKKGRRMIQIADADKLQRAAKDIPDAWTLKTPAALQKLGTLPSDCFCEVNAAPSLVRGDE